MATKMERTVRVVCHMLNSVDGTIAGELYRADNFQYFLDEYYRLDIKHFLPRTRVCFLGRKCLVGIVPTEFPAGTIKEAAPIPRTDFLADLTTGYKLGEDKRFLTVIDPHGRTCWMHPTLDSKDFPYYNGDRVIAVLVEDLVTDEYLAHLQHTNIPYIFAGKNELDCTLAVEKIGKLLGEKEVTLHGGGTINGTFLHQHCLDELSVIQVPVISGNVADLRLFTPSPELPDKKIGRADMEIEQVEKLQHSGLWIVYKIKNRK